MCTLPSHAAISVPGRCCRSAAVHRLPPESPAARRRQQTGQHPLRALQPGAFSAQVRTRSSLGVCIRLVLLCLMLLRRGLCSSSIPTELAARQTSPRALDGWRGTARSELPYDDVALSLPSLLICSRPRSNWLTAAVALQNGWGVCLEQDVVRSHRLVERQYGWQERDRQVRIALG